MIYGRSPILGTSLLPREKWVDSRFHTGIDKMLEDLVGDTEQRNESS